LDTIAIQLIKFEYLNPTVSNKKNILLYDYWSLNSTLALALIKKKNPKIKFIARAHGFDIYDKQNIGLGVLFRFFILKHIDKQFLISKNGFEYQKNKINKKLHNKLEISRLGVDNSNKINNHNVKKDYIIVSCSSILDFKRVHIIPKILNKINSIKIKWIHFGSGNYQRKLEEECFNLNINIDFELKGHVENDQILNFYANNKVDLFLSLSKMEGLPFSMMEAQSYGIPIIGYDIDGIPEIVINDITGFLLSENMNDNEIANIIKNALLNPLDRGKIYHLWEENFNAKKNYEEFTNLILNLLCVE
jgi:glycosyltransferase involved in cell wall biosynthesis